MVTSVPSSPQPDQGHLCVPVPEPQRSDGLPNAEEGPGRAPAPEPVRFGWVKGMMVSAGSSSAHHVFFLTY